MRDAYHDADDVDQIGNSIFDKDGAEKVAGLLEKAKAKNIKVVFPVDYVTADKFDKDAKARLPQHAL
jgi:3-phosphoglycerate kinase